MNDGENPFDLSARYSRLRKLRGSHRTWTAPNGSKVKLPVVLELVQQNPQNGRIQFIVESTIDLVAGEPVLTQLVLRADDGVDTVYAQRFFRWATPLDVIRRVVPALIEQGTDPFDHNYAVDGYPDAAHITGGIPTRVSDEFLEEVARQYLSIGRGYAKVIALQRGVSRRTVVSWIEKARKRGILTAVRRGSVGGAIVPAGERRQRR